MTQRMGGNEGEGLGEKREGWAGASYLTRFRASQAAVTHVSFGRDCQLVFSCYPQTTAGDH